MFDALRKELIESYKPKLMAGIRCAICGTSGKPLSLHVLEYYHASATASPAAFVPMSQSHGTTRGSVPICTSCAPPCEKCGLPITTPWHQRIGTLLQSQIPDVTIRHGQGYCRHVHPLADFLSLFKSVRVASSKHQDSTSPEDQYLAIASGLITAQLMPKYSSPKEAFGSLMTNKIASGYLFGFHDSLLQTVGLYDASNKASSLKIMERSYKNMFGEQAGYALFSSSLHSQDDRNFAEGRMNGGNEIIQYLKEKVPPLGLGRILILGTSA